MATKNNPETGLEAGVEVSHDFPNPETDPEIEKQAANLSEEEIKGMIEGTATPKSPEPEKTKEPKDTKGTKESETGEPEPAPQKEQPELDIPKKFQKEDGSLDEEKLRQSRAELEDYFKAQRDFTKSRQTKQSPESGNFDKFKEQIQEDFDRDPTGTMLRLVNAAGGEMSQRHSHEIETLKNELELERMFHSNEEMTDKDTLNALKEIRQERPYLTWRDAFEIYKGRTGEKAMRNSTRSKPKAPPVPGGTTPSTPSTTPSKINLDNIDKVLEGKSPQEQEKILSKILPHR